MSNSSSISHHYCHLGRQGWLSNTLKLPGKLLSLWQNFNEPGICSKEHKLFLELILGKFDIGAYTGMPTSTTYLCSKSTEQSLSFSIHTILKVDQVLLYFRFLRILHCSSQCNPQESNRQARLPGTYKMGPGQLMTLYLNDITCISSYLCDISFCPFLCDVSFCLAHKWVYKCP